jgi:hypothetical protein
MALSKRKAAVTAPALLAVFLSRAGPQQRNIFLKKKNSLPMAFPGPWQRNYFIFF